MGDSPLEYCIQILAAIQARVQHSLPGFTFDYKIEIQSLVSAGIRLSLERLFDFAIISISCFIPEVEIGEHSTLANNQRVFTSKVCSQWNEKHFPDLNRVEEDIPQLIETFKVKNPSLAPFIDITTKHYRKFPTLEYLVSKEITVGFNTPWIEIDLQDSKDQSYINEMVEDAIEKLKIIIYLYECLSGKKYTSFPY